MSDSLAPRLLSNTTQHNRRLTHSVSQETNKNRERGGGKRQMKQTEMKKIIRESRGAR